MWVGMPTAVPKPEAIGASAFPLDEPRFALLSEWADNRGRAWSGREGCMPTSRSQCGPSLGYVKDTQ